MSEIKICKKCGRELPHDYYHFPTDKKCKNGLRSVCRECNGLNFLTEEYAKVKYWSSEEDEILLKYCNDYSAKEIHEKFLPSRSIDAIKVRGKSTHGIKFKPHENIELIRQKGANYYLKRIQEKFNGNITCNNIEDYVDRYTLLNHHCKIHNFDFDAFPKNMMQKSCKRGCPICGGNVVVKGYNDLWTTHPEIAKFLTNPEDGYSISYGCNSKKVEFTCPDCFEIVKKTPLDVSYNGFNCKKCSDGLSYPEKFMFELLSQLRLNFETHKIFDWLNDRNYDFYLIDYNIICETHGLQHFEGGFKTLGGRTLEEEQANDKMKMETALNNGISEYFAIDCRYSNMEWIRKGIINSGILSAIKKSVDDIDWRKCAENAMKSRAILACNMWNQGKGLAEISEEFKLHPSTIREYLKKGTRIGLCNYDPKEGVLLSCGKKIICLNNKEIYDSISDFARKYNKTTTQVSSCCSGEVDFLLIDGIKYVLKYYDDFLKMSKEENEEEFNRRYYSKVNLHRGDSIVCLNNRTKFPSMRDALKWVGKEDVVGNNFRNCCLGKIPYAYKKDGENLVWMYEAEYNQATEKEIEERLFRGLYYAVNGVMIVCENTGEIFKSRKDAGKWCGMKNTEPIKKCCEGLREYAGKHPMTGESLSWKFYKKDVT